MKHLAYALATALLIMTVPGAVQAEDPPSEPEDDGPCNTFQYNLDPPAYSLRPECIDLPGPFP